MVKILLIGNGAREHVIAETLKKNKQTILYSYLKSKNPGIISLADDFKVGNYNDLEKISSYAKEIMPNFAFIGPEEPLNNGVVDLLAELKIDAIGPTKSLARLETSKSFTRNLLRKYKIDGNPEFNIFSKDNINTAKKFIEDLEKCVIKPDGLTGGKGVKVQGEHFRTKKEGLAYCNEILKTHPYVIVEEKLEGEEFSLQCLTDGKTVISMPPVQDHKRAFVDDKGPNCGGMGSYSCDNHLLPFLTKRDLDEALKMTQKVATAIHKETGEFYKGVMYAGLIVTKNGIKLLEYNARFGDPEAMNVLALMETDFVDLCNAVIGQQLHKIKTRFKNKATVCKYVVPEGYPDNPAKDKKIIIEKFPQNAKIYYAGVEQRESNASELHSLKRTRSQVTGVYTTASRAIACLGIADTLENAEKIAESATLSIKGKVYHRKDIGTKKLIEKRIMHMKRILN